MKRFKITYKVKLKTWEERYLIVSAYTKSEAKDKFELWEGLITDKNEI